MTSTSTGRKRSGGTSIARPKIGVDAGGALSLAESTVYNGPLHNYPDYLVAPVVDDTNLNSCNRSAADAGGPKDRPLTSWSFAGNDWSFLTNSQTQTSRNPAPNGWR
jgi:hypothetical protein